MSNALTASPSRRALLAASLALAAAPRSARAAAPPPVVTILGDSITAGRGLAAAQALPAQLQAALARRGVPASVRGAGVSGDTSADGLARVDFSVQGDTRLCVVALGGNDLLQGLPPAALRANLTAIVRRLKARHIAVLLCGLHAPGSLNAAYARQFNAAFRARAAAGARRSAMRAAPRALGWMPSDWFSARSSSTPARRSGYRATPCALATAVKAALNWRA